MSTDRDSGFGTRDSIGESGIPSAGSRIPSRGSPRWLTVVIILLALITVGYVATPYLRAASLVVRAANVGGRIEAFANGRAREVTVQPRHMLTTRYGNVAAQFFRPDNTPRRTILMVPGVHSMGIDEPRLTALAKDLAGEGVNVMTMALPDLMQYQITARSADIIEDAVAWMASRNDLAPDGRVGIIGISFAGGLSIVAAGRPSIRDKVAFVVSFGGHSNLARVLRYLCTGEEIQVPGVETHPPHDYGVAVLLYAGAERVVPREQAAPLRQAVGTFLLASQLTLVDMNRANATFAKARDMVKSLPEPAATYLTYVNDRNVKALGPVLVPHLALDDPAASPDAAPPPSAPVYLLHGVDDTVIPAAESVILANHLRSEKADVHLLLSRLITHAEVDRTAAASEVWRLVSFWAGVLRQ